MKTVNALTISVTTLVLATTACIKTYIPTPPPPPSSTTLSVTAISPTSGMAGINDTITGVGFSAALANDSVFFNGKSANIISASATQLIVVVPSSVSTGYVSVDVSGRTATGPVFALNTDTTNYANDTAYTVSTMAITGIGANDIVLDANGNLVVVDNGRNLIHKITPAGVISTFVGNGQDTAINGVGTNASLHAPHNIAIDPSGNFYITEALDNDIRKITPNGAISGFVGNPSIPGWTGGDSAYALFNLPTALSSDNAGNILVFDYDNWAIRKITPAAQVSDVCGIGSFGYADGLGGSIGIVSGICVDPSNNIWICDQLYNTVRKISPSGVLSPSGVPTTVYGVADRNNSVDSDGVGTQARFQGPADIASDKYGNLYVADAAVYSRTIRKITPNGVVTTIAGIPGVQGSADGPGHQATFQNPTALVVAPNGTIYVCDGNIRVLTPHH